MTAVIPGSVMRLHPAKTHVSRCTRICRLQQFGQIWRICYKTKMLFYWIKTVGATSVIFVFSLNKLLTEPLLGVVMGYFFARGWRLRQQLFLRAALSNWHPLVCLNAHFERETPHKRPLYPMALLAHVVTCMKSLSMARSHIFCYILLCWGAPLGQKKETERRKQASLLPFWLWTSWFLSVILLQNKTAQKLNKRPWFYSHFAQVWTCTHFQDFFLCHTWKMHPIMWILPRLSVFFCRCNALMEELSSSAIGSCGIFLNKGA